MVGGGFSGAEVGTVGQITSFFQYKSIDEPMPAIEVGAKSSRILCHMSFRHESGQKSSARGMTRAGADVLFFSERRLRSRARCWQLFRLVSCSLGASRLCFPRTLRPRSSLMRSSISPPGSCSVPYPWSWYVLVSLPPIYIHIK